MKEIWKDIKDYEGLYQVSNLGKIKSLSRKIFNGKNYYISKEKILKPGKNHQGYLQLTLHNNNIKKNIRINRIVAQTFLENPNNYPEVNHKDENKLNNQVDNLEWCTHKYNSNYGTGRKRAGDNHKKKIICITTGEVFNSITEAINKYDLSTCGQIAKCCKGKQKTAGKHPQTGEKLTWKYYIG